MENLPVDEKTLQVLATGSDESVAAVWRRLARHHDDYVRWHAAKNELTPLSSLAALAEDIDWPVRCMVAENPNTPKVLLDKLAEDREETVRNAVAKRRNPADWSNLGLAVLCRFGQNN